jgi:uncharacterized protein involved in response to NO
MAEAAPAAVRAPFRRFFLAAAADAVLGAAAWLLPAAGMHGIGRDSVAAGEWHRNLLLFGTIPTILAGFLLTALPRWTGRQGPSKRIVRLLLLLWLSGRGAFAAVSPTAGLFLAVLFTTVLLWFVARAVLASADRRNITVVLLVAVFWASAAATAASWHTEGALRMGLAAIVGLLMIIGGRVAHALTAAYAEHAGSRSDIALSEVVERGAALAAACALCAWVAAPELPATGLLCGLAAVGQAARLAQWRGWRSRVASVVALHAGYGWIVAGFALHAINIFEPERLGRLAAIHAWTIGAAGTMALAIMASMIRRHCGRAFARSARLTAAFAAITASCLLRLGVESWPRYATPAAALSAAFWIAAFILFLSAFRRQLLGPA